MGLKKQPRIRPYRMSRAGRSLLHQIESLVSKNIIGKAEKTIFGVNKNNLIEITKEANNTKFLDITHMNVRSIRNKAPQIQLEIGAQGIDVCAITETWLRPSDEEAILLQQITPPGYDIVSYPRCNGKTGGGLAVVYKKHIKLQNHSNMKNLKTMECGQFQIKFRSDIISLFVIYHIPSTSVLQFCEELVSILENGIRTIRNKILFMGNFNIHMDQPEEANTIIFNDVHDSLNLRNNITFHTHISSHTLDLIIDDQTESLVKYVKKGHTFVDHSLIQATIDIEKYNPLDKLVTYRKFKNINEIEFRKDLKDHLTECGTHEELEAKIDCYSRVILATLDKHAPQKTKLVKVSHKQPWFSDRIKAEIRIRWKKELIWTKDPNEYTYQAFYNQRHYCSNIIKSAQRQYCKEKAYRESRQLQRNFQAN